MNKVKRRAMSALLVAVLVLGGIGVCDLLYPVFEQLIPS